MNSIVGNETTVQNQTAETKKKILHDRGKNSAVFQKTSCMCALFSKSKYFRHQSERNTQGSRYRRQRRWQNSCFSLFWDAFLTEIPFSKGPNTKPELKTYPGTQQLCATNVRTEVDPSHNKNPCGCKVLEFFFGGVASNMLRSQAEDLFFLRMTLPALFVRLIINL